MAHSGTAALDLAALGAPPQRSWSALIGDAERAGIQMPEPLEWEAHGRLYPNIHVLEDSTKDWIYENGLYHPPMPAFGGFWNPGHSFVTTSTVRGIWIQPGSQLVVSSGAQAFRSPTPSLPVEKREMPVIGYRSWRAVSKFRLGWGRYFSLSSLNENFGSWKRGKNTATCRIDPNHVPADQNCQCGFYVLSQMDSAVNWAGGMTDEIVIGAVMGWGRVVQHGQEGWRAGQARVIALLDCKYSKAQTEATQKIAKAYGVGIFERAGLEAYVAEWGDPFSEAGGGEQWQELPA